MAQKRRWVVSHPDELLEAGYAYESFSTPEEIKERNLAAGRPAEFGYEDRKSVV